MSSDDLAVPSNDASPTHGGTPVAAHTGATRGRGTAATVRRRSAGPKTPATKTPATKTPAMNGHHPPALDARAAVAAVRREVAERFRPQVAAGAAPIRVMVRMVHEVEDECRARGIAADVIAREVVNRTIGDVNLRAVSPRDDGAEFVSLADDMGLALPGEVIGGRESTGERYRWIHERMLDFERELLARHWDMRMYDIAGVGNPVLRELLRKHAVSHWGFCPPASEIFLSLGALDGLDKFFRGYMMARRAAGDTQVAVVFPAPSFNVPEWQAKSLGYRMHRLYTRPEDHFKVTPAMLRDALDKASDIRAFYLTVSNNPTAFAYSPAELRALFDVVASADRELLIVADLAYIGTGDLGEDRARMAEFNRPDVLERTVFVWSFSKSHTLTGDRCGWVAFGDPQLAARVIPGWINTVASLPADWQLRYMANVRLFAEHPELEQRIRALYHHRRERLHAQLLRLDKRHQIFARVNLDDGGTVYNWSQLRPGEDVFTLFGATGIAGVPGDAFGYSDDFVRLSVGCIPIPSD
ncbi:MAG: pyridoxal phosphate-dependent aminotransferase [Ktedonobacterales bacterium]